MNPNCLLKRRGYEAAEGGTAREEIDQAHLGVRLSRLFFTADLFQLLVLWILCEVEKMARQTPTRDGSADGEKNMHVRRFFPESGHL